MLPPAFAQVLSLGEQLRLQAVAELRLRVAAGGRAGVAFALAGSAAQPGMFTPRSDLDVFAVGADQPAALAGAAELERGWPAGRPELDLSVATPQAPDPHLRVAVWLGGPGAVQRQLTEALLGRQCQRAHVLESFCEGVAAGRQHQRRRGAHGSSWRSHPDGFRALWRLAHLSPTAPEPKPPAGWLARLLGADHERVAAASRALRAERALAAAERAERVGHASLAILRAGCAQATAARMTELGLEPQALLALSARPVAVRRQAALRGSQSDAVFLAWTDADAAVLHALAERARPDEQIAMGLAFNRATPAQLVMALSAAPWWDRCRPTLRHRCYCHRGIKALSDPAARGQYYRQQIEREALPKLQAKLSRLVLLTML